MKCAYYVSLQEERCGRPAVFGLMCDGHYKHAVEEDFGLFRVDDDGNVIR